MSADSSPQKPTAKEKTFLGAPLEEWSKGVIVLLVGILGTLFTVWFTGSKPHLTVKVSDIAKFQGDKHNPGFASVNIQSDGSKEAEEVECQFTLSNVQEVKVSPANLNATVVVKDARVSVKAAVMNPGESMTIAAYTSNTAGVPERPEVSVRGKGVIGDPTPPTSPSTWILWTITIGTCLGNILIVWSSFQSMQKRSVERQAEHEKRMADHEQFMAESKHQRAERQAEHDKFMAAMELRRAEQQKNS